MSGGASRIVLPPSMSMADAVALAERLRADAATPVVLDAAAVETISTPCVLTLVSALGAGGGGPPISVSAPSEAFIDAFGDLGFFEDLMAMEFAP